MKVHKFLLEHTGENRGTKKSVKEVFDPEQHTPLLSEKKSAFISHDFDQLVDVTKYAVGEIELPDWLEPGYYASNTSLQVSLKWFKGFGGGLDWPEQWFRKLTKLGEVERYAAIQLLKCKNFRSSFRQSLRNQLEIWLNGESEYGSPFSHRQWQTLLNHHTVQEAKARSTQLYWDR